MKRLLTSVAIFMLFSSVNAQTATSPSKPTNTAKTDVPPLPDNKVSPPAVPLPPPPPPSIEMMEGEAIMPPPPPASIAMIDRETSMPKPPPPPPFMKSDSDFGDSDSIRKDEEGTKMPGKLIAPSPPPISPFIKVP